MNKIEKIGKLDIDTPWSESEIEEIEKLLLRCMEFLAFVYIDMAKKGKFNLSDSVLDLLRSIAPVGLEKF